jgi:tetratricopeptide (TPR) repeat protein
MDTISRRIRELHAEGRAHWRAGRITEAERVYRAMVDEARAAGEGLPAALRADAHHWAAHFYRDTGRLTAAEAFAREAITLEERAGRAVILANHRMFLAQLLEARAELREALAQAELSLEAMRAAMGAEHSETRYYASVVTRLRSVAPPANLDALASQQMGGGRRAP